MNEYVQPSSRDADTDTWNTIGQRLQDYDRAPTCHYNNREDLESLLQCKGHAGATAQRLYFMLAKALCGLLPQPILTQKSNIGIARLSGG